MFYRKSIDTIRSIAIQRLTLSRKFWWNQVELKRLIRLWQKLALMPQGMAENLLTQMVESLMVAASLDIYLTLLIQLLVWCPSAQRQGDRDILIVLNEIGLRKYYRPINKYHRLFPNINTLEGSSGPGHLLINILCYLFLFI